MSDDDKRRPDQTGPGSADGSEEAPQADKADKGDNGTSANDRSEDELTVDDILAAAGDDGQAAGDTATVLQATLEERTRDLQRLNAEFQNYRKRVERDKSRAGEQAAGSLLSALLPILDDLDRAREHGDLNGPFASVAEQLGNALAKQGLESFGEKGDAFDPTIHEAVAHMQMADVDGPTCIDVMRSGYRLGDRMLRAALVAVAEPLDEDAELPETEVAEAEPSAEPSETEAESPAGEPAEAEQVDEEPVAEADEDEVEETLVESAGSPAEPSETDVPSKADEAAVEGDLGDETEGETGDDSDETEESADQKPKGDKGSKVGRSGKRGKSRKGD